MSTPAKFKIQIVGLLEDNGMPVLKTLGFLFVENKTQVVFNPSLKSFKNMHWTWHKDGTVHARCNKKIYHKFKRYPLDKFKSSSQFLFSGERKEAKDNIPYTFCENSGIFMIDLRNFKKGIGLSIHISDYNNVNTVAKAFNDRAGHQCFIFWKSCPKIIIHAFDN